jgi:hypothetical protein
MSAAWLAFVQCGRLCNVTRRRFTRGARWRASSMPSTARATRYNMSIKLVQHPDGFETKGICAASVRALGMAKAARECDGTAMCKKEPLGCPAAGAQLAGTAVLGPLPTC